MMDMHYAVRDTQYGMMKPANDVGIVGYGAGELISEGVLAVEMGATAKDLSLAVHPHPTLSETLMEAAEAFYGHSTHMVVRKSGVVRERDE